MRLERSAERDKRNYKNTISAIYAQSETEGIKIVLLAKGAAAHRLCSGSF